MSQFQGWVTTRFPIRKSSQNGAQKRVSSRATSSSAALERNRRRANRPTARTVKIPVLASQNPAVSAQTEGRIRLWARKAAEVTSELPGR